MTFSKSTPHINYGWVSFMFNSFIWLFSFPKLEKENFISLFANSFYHKNLQSYRFFKLHTDFMDTLNIKELKIFWQLLTISIKDASKENTNYGYAIAKQQKWTDD